MMHAPIVVFAYNRLDHLTQVITAILSANGGEESKIIVVSDGPRNKYDEKKIFEIRSYLFELRKRIDLETILHEENVGVDNSVTNTLNELFKIYDRLIILEDDIVIGRDALVYFNDALELFKNNKEVYHISGYTEPIDLSGLPNHFFSSLASCWGWATWKDRWEENLKNPYKLLQKIYADNNIYNKMKALPFNLMGDLVFVADSSLEAWDAIWGSFILSNNGMVLMGNKSYVRNIGHDASGLHGLDSKMYEVGELKRYQNLGNEVIEYSKQADDMKESFYSVFDGTKKSLISRIRNILVERIKFALFTFLGEEQKIYFKLNRLRRFELFSFSFLGHKFSIIDKESFLNDYKLFVKNLFVNSLDISSSSFIDFLPSEGAAQRIIESRICDVRLYFCDQNSQDPEILRSNLKTSAAECVDFDVLEKIVCKSEKIGLMRVSNLDNSLKILLENLEKVQNFILFYTTSRASYQGLSELFSKIEGTFVLKIEDYGIEGEQFIRNKYKKNASFVILGSRK